MKLTRKLLPPLALVGALAMVPVTTSSLAAADTPITGARDVHQRLRAGEGQLCRQGRRPYADQGRDRRHARRARPAFQLCRSVRLRPAQDDHRRQLRRPRPHRLDRGRRGEGRSRRPRTRPHGAPGSRPATTSRTSTASCSTASSLDEAVEKMRGKPGTTIKLTIVRPGRDKPFDVSHDPRADRAPAGQVGSQGRHRHHQHQRLLGQLGDADQGGAAGDRQGDRRQAARLCRRPSLQPGRPARPGDRGQRRLPRAAARSFPSAAARRTISSAIMHVRATWRTACR